MQIITAFLKGFGVGVREARLSERSKAVAVVVGGMIALFVVIGNAL